MVDRNKIYVMLLFKLAWSDRMPNNNDRADIHCPSRGMITPILAKRLYARSVPNLRSHCAVTQRVLDLRPISDFKSPRECRMYCEIGRDGGKMVLPCRPKFPRRDKSFFQGRFGAASIFVQAIRWTPT